MGDMADALLDGIFCQGCGELLDEAGTGFPGYCIDCQPTPRGRHASIAEKDNEKTFEVRAGVYSKYFADKLRDAGFEVLEHNMIDHAYQYKLGNGSIICLFKTGRFSLGGTKNRKLRTILFSFYQNNF